MEKTLKFKFFREAQEISCFLHCDKLIFLHDLEISLLISVQCMIMFPVRATKTAETREYVRLSLIRLNSKEIFSFWIAHTFC